MMLKYSINKFLQTLLPAKIYLNLLIWKRGFEEPELKLVNDLCDRSLISIDVGAANGLYLAHLYSISKECYAFEPRKKALQNLKNIFSGITDSIKFENVALSNFTGYTKLKVLKSNNQLSTIEEGNLIERFGLVDLVKVPVMRLDDYEFDARVGFIKIDVEGHEMAVLEGALKLIERDKPNLLIEIEDRHKPNSVTDINEFLMKYDYDGYFFLDDHLVSMVAFDIKLHQNFGSENGKYIFNFIFVHQSAIPRIAHLI